MSKLTGSLFDLKEELENVMNEDNKEELLRILEAFSHEEFKEAVEQSKQVSEKYEDDNDLLIILKIMEAMCYTQLEEENLAVEVLNELYHQRTLYSNIRLLFIGEIAFMNDYKLARRVLSEAIKQLEESKDQDEGLLARAHLVLGEAEENLEKFIRANKYYIEGLHYLEHIEDTDEEMIIYLHFKIGMLYLTTNDTPKAVDYLKQTIERARKNPESKEITIHSLVSIAKAYADENKLDESLPYLDQAIQLLENSELKGSSIHAEALTEMGFFHFNKKLFKEAVPYYKQALDIYNNVEIGSMRKLGMIYMQYAYCLEHQEKENIRLAGKNYEAAIRALEQTVDEKLLENAIGDIITFFDQTNNQKKKKQYEEKRIHLLQKKAEQMS